MRVLIADDQPSVRSALRLVLEQYGVEVAGEVAESCGLIDWLKKNRTDLILLDWELPGQPAKRTLSRLHAQRPSVSAVVLDSQPQNLSAAFAAGADGFVCKGDPPEYLLKALNRCQPYYWDEQ